MNNPFPSHHQVRRSRRSWLAAICLLAGFALLLPAHAAELTSAPLPVLEPGMHTAMINRIASDAAGRWAVTASDDKTARVWDLSTGEMLRVLRPPQDGGDEGKLYAVALSPDGATVALAGWAKAGYEGFGNHNIYLLDRIGGTLLRRIGSLPNVINHLAWSPDGNTLAVTLGSGGGLRLYHADGNQRSHADDCEERSNSVHFRADSRRLVTTCYDGKVRLYGLDKDGLHLLTQRASAGGKQPYSARFSPDGRQIAVGFAGSTTVQVLDADTLAEQARPSVAGVDNGNLGRVAWSADGRYLYAAGTWDMQGKSPLRRWSAGEWQHYRDQPLSEDTVMELVPLPDNRLLYAAADPAWGIVAEDGQVVLHRSRQGADLSGQHDQLQLSPDGSRVRFGYRAWGKDPALFDLARRSLEAPGQPLATACTQAPVIQVENWKNGKSPRLNGQPLTLQDFEVSLSLAIAPDASRFVLGTGWWLRMYDPTGQSLWWQPVPDVAYAVNFSPDGRWLVAGYGDGTIRWHRVADGKEVLAFFPHADRKRWVVWTPEGFYDASEGGEELMGYHLNHGRDRAGEFVSAGQLREKYYQPGLIARRLDADGDVLLAEAVKRLGDVRQALAVPRTLVERLSPQEVSGAEAVAVTVRVKDQGGGVERLVYFVDGRPQEGVRQASVAMDGTVTRSFALPSERRHLIEVAALNRAGVLGPKVALSARVTGAQRQPALHILAVGVKDYAKELKLAHSDNDARALAGELAQRAQPLYPRGVFSKVLTDAEATSAGIEAAFNRLAQGFQPQDTLVLFLAGHGEAPIGRGYVFLTHDFDRSKPERNGLDEARLRALLERSPARTLLLVDTCDAGGATDMVADSYDRLKGMTKLAVIGASRRGEFAREGWQNHGVFTAALLETLKRPAGPDDDKDMVSVMEVSLYVKNSVKRIAEKLGKGAMQRVDSFIGRTDFPLVAR